MIRTNDTGRIVIVTRRGRDGKSQWIPPPTSTSVVPLSLSISSYNGGSSIGGSAVLDVDVTSFAEARVREKESSLAHRATRGNCTHLLPILKFQRRDHHHPILLQRPKLAMQRCEFAFLLFHLLQRIIPPTAQHPGLTPVVPLETRPPVRTKMFESTIEGVNLGEEIVAGVVELGQQLRGRRIRRKGRAFERVVLKGRWLSSIHA